MGLDFKRTVLRLLENDIYPSPGRIQEVRGQTISHNLNGRECKWRDEILTAWMIENPKHIITLLRNKRRMITGAEIMQMQNEDAIAGLLEIEADLRPG